MHFSLNWSQWYGVDSWSQGVGGRYVLRWISGTVLYGRLKNESSLIFLNIKNVLMKVAVIRSSMYTLSCSRRGECLSSGNSSKSYSFLACIKVDEPGGMPKMNVLINQSMDKHQLAVILHIVHMSHHSTLMVPIRVAFSVPI